MKFRARLLPRGVFPQPSVSVLRRFHVLPIMSIWVWRAFWDRDGTFLSGRRSPPVWLLCSKLECISSPLFVPILGNKIASLHGIPIAKRQQFIKIIPYTVYACIPVCISCVHGYNASSLSQSFLFPSLFPHGTEFWTSSLNRFYSANFFSIKHSLVRRFGKTSFCFSLYSSCSFVSRSLYIFRRALNRQYFFFPYKLRKHKRSYCSLIFELED